MVTAPDAELDNDFDAVGIGDGTRLVYRYVLAQGTVRVDDVARDVPLDGTDLAGTVAGSVAGSAARLRTAGLINRTSGVDGEYPAVDPRLALRALTDRTAAQLDRIRASIGDLADLFEHTAGTSESGAGVHVLDDPALIGAWYTRLEHEVTGEFMAFDRPPYVLAGENPVEPLVLERGVLWRAVYAAEVLDRPGASPTPSCPTPTPTSARSSPSRCRTARPPGRACWSREPSGGARTAWRPTARESSSRPTAARAESRRRAA
jgi:hypothetical protein